MTLDKLQPGHTARIESLLTKHTELKARIQAMGLRPGRLVTLVRRCRFGGPLQVRIGTTDLILRRQQASEITMLANSEVA